VAGSSLRFLNDRLHACGIENCGNISGLMADDGNDGARLDGLTGSNDVVDQSATAGAVQHLGEGRLEARSLAGSQDDDGKIRQSHGCSILRCLDSFWQEM
jgi:hypothetical protein